jgi:hypothetical protein
VDGFSPPEGQDMRCTPVILLGVVGRNTFASVTWHIHGEDVSPAVLVTPTRT